jgi:hypothetical protein
MVRHRIGGGGRQSLISSIIEELVATLSKAGKRLLYTLLLGDTSAIAVLQATEGILKSNSAEPLRRMSGGVGRVITRLCALADHRPGHQWWESDVDLCDHVTIQQRCWIVRYSIYR